MVADFGEGRERPIKIPVYVRNACERGDRDPDDLRALAVEENAPDDAYGHVSGTEQTVRSIGRRQLVAVDLHEGIGAIRIACWMRS
jgi:hypothetical protein